MKNYKTYVLMLLVLLFTGCEKENLELRIATNIWPGYEPLYLAKKLDTYGDLNVDFVEMANATEVIRAYRNGVVDAAAVTADEAFLLAQNHDDFYIAFIIDISNGGDVIIARSPISDLEGLKGKKVGLENTALGAFVLSRALELSKIDRKEITVIPMTVDEHEKAFKTKEVDAVVTFEPIRTKLLNAGGNQVFDSSRIPGEIVDVVIIRKSYVGKNKKAFEKFLKGWFKALDVMKTDPENSMKILAARLGMTEEETTAAFNGMLMLNKEENIEFLFGDSPKFLNNMTKLQDVMLKNKILENRIDLKTLLPKKEYGELY